MARSWHELFITGEDTPPTADDQPEERQGFFRRLRQNLSKTREALGAELQASGFQTLDDEAWERLEGTLVYAHVGAPPPPQNGQRGGTRGRARGPPPGGGPPRPPPP